MLGKLTGWEDTIVALATPPGVGAIGVIRVSGKQAIKIVAALFPGKDLEQQASHTLHVGVLKEGEEALDEVVVSLFQAPRSYTGEHVVEISCHGSAFVLERVISALLHGGARLARAGEFTQRAFLNGKLDLAQAEAVADLISSQTAAAARTALHTVRGGFSRALRDLRERLISFSALIELELDFSQEDVEFADRTQLYHLIDEASSTTGQLLQSFRLGNVIRNGVAVAIVGKPNAGKSTLLNTLLQQERAIVSEIAGTTRDTIEETLNIGGILFRLIDTAGIREHTVDVIEQIGVGRSLEKMEQADVVIYLFDVAETYDEVRRVREELAGKGKTFLLVGNKVDAAAGGGGFSAGAGGTTETGVSGGAGNAGDAPDSGDAVAASVAEGAGDDAGRGGVDADSDSNAESEKGKGSEEVRILRTFSSHLADTENAAQKKFAKDTWSVGGNVRQVRFPEEVLISAKEGRGIDVLKQRLVDLVLKGEAADGTMVTNARHFEALRKVDESLRTLRQGLDELLPGDLLSLDIRHCLHYLGEITGEITTEDRLDYIFSKFCIGK
jgi:tRNA modification GTPase